MVFLPNPPKAGKSHRYAQKIILGISIIYLRLFFSHALILNKNPHLWTDTKQFPFINGHFSDELRFPPAPLGRDFAFDYSNFQKYVPIYPFLFIFSVSRRMISFRSASCLSKLERVKANSIKVYKIDVKNTLPHHDLNS